VGHSVGELACGYADGSLSHSEAVLAAYWRGRCIKDANLPPGGMAAVGEEPRVPPCFSIFFVVLLLLLDFCLARASGSSCFTMGSHTTLCT